MNLLAHITAYDIGFVLAAFLLGLATGFTVAWGRHATPATKLSSEERKR